MEQPIFWFLTPGGLKAIYNDDDPLFLIHDCGCCSKRLSDYMVEIGHWQIITNPLEIYTLQVFDGLVDNG